MSNKKKILRREPIAAEFDPLSLAHNLVVSPISVVAAFSATRLQGCQSSAIKVAHRPAIGQKR